MPKFLVSCALGLGVAALGLAAPASAQVRTVDPNQAIQADVTPVPADEAGYGTNVTAPAPAADPVPAETAAGAAPVAQENATYQENDVLAAAEGVFGKGAEGLAKMIEGILKDQGEPNGYIVGREAGGALAIGVRYGSGTMFHKVEGQRPVYWTGPSVGFDIGANGAKTFVLVYNLYDSQELYQRFPAVEGTAYVVGGFTASYLRRGDVVLIPIRLGVGWRLGANVGYMKFTEKSSILPF
ncbi:MULTISPECIES: DUF1134 domain-containing protein [Edaphosphingomonas]|uniref:DUF1134 domain-containing protein n=2 Tax=Edaphosphingomonas TaxID=3423724 RepID=A0A2T4HVZ8_9SPHN|nr:MULTISPECIES: DUF1134 domain-containing protein [Sphingomonas]MDX3884191.1 DUF1134 domain-containing protein [Sphingomonas sp.]OHT21212.1 hypothetical protein BHE75_03217 [Sphingomonas haloaromaticamans]PTD19930.1 DUF1134 domain-containing protein [Sphingomonas fennica]